MKIQCATCPFCGHRPGLFLPPSQAFCGNIECFVFNWDASATQAENRRDAVVLDLSGWAHGE